MIKFVCCLFSHDMRVCFTCLFRVYLRFAMETLAARHIATPSAGVRCISTSAWNSWRRWGHPSSAVNGMGCLEVYIWVYMG